jgi:hypothetical protein
MRRTLERVTAIRQEHDPDLLRELEHDWSGDPFGAVKATALPEPRLGHACPWVAARRVAGEER